MATLTYQQVSVTAGLAPVLAAATVTTGDAATPNDRGFFMVKNGSGSPINVTVVVPGNTKYGLANPDPSIAVAAGATTLIGPLPVDLGDPTTGLVTVICSSVTTVTIGAVQV